MCAGRERGEEYAGKIEDIKRKTKNTNPEFYVFFFCFLLGGGAGQEEGLAGKLEKLFSCETRVST